MDDNAVIWYILFDNYEQGLALHDILDAHGEPNRIAPAPRAIKEAAACGMALMVKDEDVAGVRKCIEENHGEYRSIVSYKGGLLPYRDRYC